MPHHDSHPVLTMGLPWLSHSDSLRWLGPRLCWWPAGIPDFQRIAIASSRVGRQLDQHPHWFDLLRTAVSQVDIRCDGLCVVPGTAAAAATARAARMWQLPTLTLTVDNSENRVTLEQAKHWMSQRRCLPERPDEQPRTQWTVEVSAELEGISAEPVLVDSEDQASQDFIQQTPVTDRLLFAAAERFYVLKCRAGGIVDRLISQRKAETERPASWIMLENKTSSSHRKLHALPNSAHSSIGAADVDQPTSLTVHPGAWLLHWTRARNAPWPDQTPEEWLDELIVGSSAADRSAFATLQKIMSDGRLIGSATGIRGGYAGVSFTAVPLNEFRQRRIFRRHRNRYDFEPWGVAIHRDVLISQGAKSVVYGNDDDWKQLPEEQRRWFQKTTRGSGATNNIAEQEWRLPGDLNLAALSPQDVCYFADTALAATQLQQYTTSLVVVVP